MLKICKAKILVRYPMQYIPSGHFKRNVTNILVQFCYGFDAQKSSKNIE